MKENEAKGCLIAAVIVLCLVLLIGTFIISDVNPKMDTAMTVIGSLIILVGAIVVFNID